MKKLLFVVTLSFALIACNQTGNNKTIDYKGLFEKSMEIKDYHTAITALQFMILSDSATAVTYVDTLPELYLAVQNIHAAEYYTDMALIKYPTSEKYLQIKALVAQSEGRNEEEFDIYNKLYASTQKLQYLYQITAFQFSSGQTKEGLNNLETLEAKAQNSKDSVDFLISETEKQKVPLKAAIYNMRAFLKAQERDMLGAKTYFELALKEFPDFVMARRNYQQLIRGGQ